MDTRARAKQAWTLIVDAGKDFASHNASHWAAAVAFYSVFSLSPLLVVAVAVAGAVFGEEAASGQIAQELDAWLGARGAGYVQQMLVRASAPGGGILAGAIGTVTLLYGSSRVFNALRSALNVIWGVEARSAEKGWRGVVYDYARSLSMVPILGVAFIGLIVLSFMTTAFEGVISTYLSLPRTVWKVSEFSLSWLFVTVAFAATFRLLPNVSIRTREVWSGAAVTALLFGLGRVGIELYFSYTLTSSTSVFGAAGTLAALLIWFFLSTQAFLFGAELLQTWVKRYGSLAPEAD